MYDVLGGRQLRSLEKTLQIAALLGLRQASVTALWTRAKLRKERDELAQRGYVPEVSPVGWLEIPMPAQWLEDLLRSQATAAEQFPYELLGVHKPPLSEVYVEQDIQPLSPDGASGHPSQTGHPVPTITAALSAHSHLFITGGPGAGKTTLGQHLVGQIARYWLREHQAEEPWCREAVAAVRVTSTDLLTPRAWRQQLSDAAARTGTLMSPVSPDHFARRPHGVRWLVIIDGLDEVSSPAIRQTILEKLAREIRPNSNCRLVITSRPLPQSELKPFENTSSIGFYTLKGFDASQQRAFAQRWFIAQGVSDPAFEAQNFLSEVDQAGLQEILQVPLLTTLAASFRSRNPHAPLPRGRVALYETFLTELRTAREGNAGIIARFRERWQVRGLGLLADWLLAHQDDIVTHLAWERIEAQPSKSLLREATQWLASQLPEGLSWPERAEGELGQFLAQTGVMTFDGSDLSFLHQSFAEFIAARDEAAEIPADFPDLDVWSAAVSNAAARNRILFTFALWARMPGNDVSLIIRHLLAGDLEHRIMALRLVTAGVPLGEALEGSIINRLMDFADDSGKWTLSPGSQVLSELSQLRGNRRLAAHLRKIAETEGLAFALRIQAAAAYANAASLVEGVELLKTLSESADPIAVLSCCRHLTSLDPQGIPFRVRRLKNLLTDPRASNWERLGAAEQLMAMGYTDNLVDLARTILTGPEQSGQHLERAGELWFSLQGHDAAKEVAEAISGRTDNQFWSTKGLAMTMIRFGLVEQVIPFARRIFDESSSDDDISEFVTAWIDSAGSTAADQIVEVMREHPAWNVDERPSVAHDLLLNGFNSQAAELVRISLAATPHKPYSLHLELMTLVRAVGPEAADEVQEWLEKLQGSSEDYASSMADLIESGATPGTFLPFARRVLHHPGSPDKAFSSAARMLFRHDRQAACKEVIEALQARPYSGSALRARLLPILAEHNEVTAVMEMGQELLADPGLTVPELQAVVSAWLVAAGREAAWQVVARVKTAVMLTVDQLMALADLLTSQNLTHVAAPLLCQVCIAPGVAVETRWRALQEIIKMGAEREAGQALREALVAPSSQAEALILRRLLAWLTASE
ncbi:MULTISPECIES: NACHT domain-containing protein [unclassified Streptomyces]|uniref:NACHT domain-containing protein n=1 Tax=unclassified Streptomyces TaxID=2593676 RepID=UPI0036F0881B